jgi:hypothetical protein
VIGSAYRVLIGRPKGKRSVEVRQAYGWEDTIEISQREIGWEGLDWTRLAQELLEGSCDHGEGRFGSIKAGEFLN